jgi:hypothetical protein
MGLKLKYDNCVNCGAVVRGCKCAYCGTEYSREIEFNTPLSQCWSGTYQSYYTCSHGSWHTSNPSRVVCTPRGNVYNDTGSPDVAHEVIGVAADIVESIIDLGC